jgi:hypothetical protein
MLLEIFSDMLARVWEHHLEDKADRRSGSLDIEQDIGNSWRDRDRHLSFSRIDLNTPPSIKKAVAEDCLWFN